MEDEEDHPQRSQKWLKDMSKGIVSHEIEAITLQGLQIELAQKGLIRCKFVVPEHLSDRDGNWHVGAIAVLVDDVGAAAIFSYVGHIKASVGFNVSYLSTAKISGSLSHTHTQYARANLAKLSIIPVRLAKIDGRG
ncbi:uncharacterized protein LOC130750025 isoform X1 [Actinidia eriantha]|uniref:uncharacterized protein LOC130750025 isoform X1 n=1 Tax=Actinidia eriantha TaxID=165200 RepID=UPI00258A6673|nr:uncharacterized protein LOC130750025 isoform X1 [Actinidia eriantha]